MNRNTAHEITRSELDKWGLNDWKVKLALNQNDPYLGLCVYKDKTIMLNMHHIDIHHDKDIINTIKHEVAHALTPGHGHDSVWQQKAIEVGCDNTLPCSHLNLPDHVIDAIRSGQTVEVEIEEVTHVVRTPTYKVTRLQEKCPDCGKVAEEKFSQTFVNKNGNTVKMITLKCFHIIMKVIPKATPFDEIVSNDWKPEVKNCKHVWDKTVCKKCNQFKLYQFQVDGSRTAESGLSVQKGFGIFDEMGLGKTIQALALIKFHPEYTPTLYIVKSALTFQWFTEVLKWLGPSYLPQIIRTSRDQILPGFKSYIISYDLLRRMKDETMKQLNIRLVVMDECQQVKNPDSTRTQEVRKLVSNPDIKVIALSGTPWKNRGSEFFPILNMMDPIKFPSYQGFINRWCDYYYHGKSTKMGGIANVDKFKEYTHDLLIRREYEEVMDEFPENKRSKLSIQLDDLNLNTYESATSDFVKWYNQYVIDGTEDQISSIELLGKLSKMRHITGLAKIEATLDFIEEFLEDTDRKITVFVHHKDVGELMLNECRKRFPHVKTFQLKASEGKDDQERFDTQTKFNNTKKCILIASTLACGEGLNLQTCSDAIMHERQWNPQNEDQASPGRFRRIGQKANSINTTFIEAKDTIDEWIDQLVESKREQFHKSMNKSEMQGWTDGAMGKALAEMIVEKHKSKNKGNKRQVKISQVANVR